MYIDKNNVNVSISFVQNHIKKIHVIDNDFETDDLLRVNSRLCNDCKKCMINFEITLKLNANYKIIVYTTNFIYHYYNSTNTKFKHRIKHG